MVSSKKHVSHPSLKLPFALPSFGFAFLAAFLFGAFNPLAKIITGQVHWLAYGALVCAVSAFLALLALAAFSSKVSFDSRRWHDYLGLGLVGLAVPIVLSGLAFSLAPSIHVGLLLRFEAFFAAAFGAWLFKERLSKWQLGGIGLGLLGALVFSTNGFASISWADGLVILASAFYGTYLVFAKRLSDHDALSLVAIRFCVAAAWLLPVAFLAGVMPADPPWLQIGVLSFFLFVMGTLAYTESVEKIGVAKTGAITQFFTGVFAIAAGAWWLGETFSALEWLSAALILAGGVIVVQARH